MAGLTQRHSLTRRPVSEPSQRAPVAPARRPYALSAFDNLFAAQVARWTTSDDELCWLAPGTRPPLTAAKVSSWRREGGRPILFWAGGPDPVGYGELNQMPHESTAYWIGHFVIQPAARGRGLSHIFFRGLISYAFESLRAGEVLLVVFPENAPAIRCYQRNGLVITGRESKYFKSTNRQHEFLRMTIPRRRFSQLAQYQDRAASRLPFHPSPYDLTTRGPGGAGSD